jgi:hypothetical protein
MRLLLAVAALALPLVLACSSATMPGGSGGAADAGPPDAGPQDSGPADAGPSDTGPADAACALLSPYSSENAACNDCAQAMCCVEINGCLGDPGCNDDYVDCTIGCALDDDGGAGADAGLTMCLDGCGTQYPKGKGEYDVAIGCAEQACATECQ